MKSGPAMKSQKAGNNFFLPMMFTANKSSFK